MLASCLSFFLLPLVKTPNFLPQNSRNMLAFSHRNYLLLLPLLHLKEAMPLQTYCRREKTAAWAESCLQISKSSLCLKAPPCRGFVFSFHKQQLADFFFFFLSFLALFSSEISALKPAPKPSFFLHHDRSKSALH